MFYQTFLSPQVKRSLITIKKLIYARCPTILDLGNYKTSWNYNPQASLPPLPEIEIENRH